MIVVTAGRPYLDIDAYAGIIAYAELLNLQGKKAIAYSSSTPNESVTKSCLSSNLLTEYEPKVDDKFVIIDTSDLEYFDPIIKEDAIVEVIDHHPSHEEFWREKIGEGAKIEFIGSACTLVYELWEKADMTDSMSRESAELLSLGILDNTLNFKAKVTHQRDIDAYKKLEDKFSFGPSWDKDYFSEVQKQVSSDLDRAINNDYKNLGFKGLGKKVIVGQLVVWSASKLVDNHLVDIKSSMDNLGEQWFINIVNINKGYSCFYSEDDEIKSWLSKTLDLSFDSDLAKSDRLWLRKEIIKQDLSIN